MALTINTQLRQTQKLVMTQSLRQSIEMLQLSTLELRDLIQQELETNPVLELEEKQSEFESDGKERLESDLSRELSHDEYIESSQYREDRRLSDEFSDDESSDRNRQMVENALVRHDTLSEHLLSQLPLINLPENLELLCMKIITSLDERGYLPVDRETFATENSADAAECAQALSIVAGLDPAGCSSVSAKECLLLQAKIHYPADHLLHTIIGEHFENLSGLYYDRIARALSLPAEEIIEKSRLIQGLDPYPGRQFASGGTRYIIPDIEVKLVNGEIFITFNDEWIPRVYVSSYYAKMLEKKDIDKKLKEYIKDKVTSARLLQRNISGWRETIGKIVVAVMQHQIEFLERGPGHLKPLTHAFIAEQAECHESTVSRATTNKFIQCSWGTFELKDFFVSKIKSDEEGRSSDEVLSLIREIIAGEKTETPYSDDEIVGLLERNGVTVARRTVAKYRDILNIPSSNKRKRLNILKAEGTL